MSKENNIQQMFIPEISSKIVLSEDWEFVLYTEYRNHGFIEKVLGKSFNRYISSNEQYNVTIPKDTILTVDRIYIRKGGSDYSSITFRIPKGDSSDKKYWSTRFWAKLMDVNKIKFRFLEGDEDMTKNLLIMLNKIREDVDMDVFHKYEKVILNGKTINNFNIPLDTNGFEYYSKAIQKVKDLDKSTGCDVFKIVNKFFRKYKIHELLKD